MSDTTSETSLDLMSISSGSENLCDELTDVEDDSGDESRDKENPIATTKLVSEKKKYLMSAIATGASIFFTKYLHKTPCYDREYSG